MATAPLDVLHTAALRLREAADRFIVAFEQAAAEAATGAPPAKRERRKPLPSPARKRLTSPMGVQVVGLAGTERGTTAAEVARVLELENRAAAARLSLLASRGHLVRVALPGQTVRFFAHAEHAMAWGSFSTPLELETHRHSEYPGVVGAFPEGHPTPEVCDLPPTMNGVDIDAVHRPRQHENRLAAMVEADAPAVAAALAVIAPPQPAPSAPAPKPYIPPTPSRARGERREQLTAAAYVAPVAKPEGEAIVPPTAKITKAPTPVDKRFYVDPEAVAQDGESFSAQWKRLRGEGAEV